MASLGRLAKELTDQVGADGMISDEELERISRLAAAATAGPWRAFIEGRDHLSGSDFIRTSEDDIELSGASHADHDFIASARQDVPRLVEEVRALRARVDDLEKAVAAKVT